MIPLTVRDLIEVLEELPPNYPVVADGTEITEVLIREEIYYTEDQLYEDNVIVKLY